MAKSKQPDYKPTFVKASLVPIIVAPAVLYLLTTPDTFSPALQTYYPVIGGVWVFSMFMAFIFPRKYRFTRLLSVKGAQLGLLLHLVANYKGWMTQLISSVTWSNWIVVFGLAGLVLGYLKDTREV